MERNYVIVTLCIFLFEKYVYILALAMASPGNAHCANCIGTLSFATYNTKRQSGHRRASDDDDELRVDVVEVGELLGVDVHQQQLVHRSAGHRARPRRPRLRTAARELRVEVAHVSLSLLHHRHRRQHFTQTCTTRLWTQIHLCRTQWRIIGGGRWRRSPKTVRKYC